MIEPSICCGDAASYEVTLTTCYRQHCTQRKAPVYKLYGDLEVFRPAGATRCADGVKFGIEEWTFGKIHSSMLNFTPIGATARV